MIKLLSTLACLLIMTEFLGQGLKLFTSANLGFGLRYGEHYEFSDYTLQDEVAQGFDDEVLFTRRVKELDIKSEYTGLGSVIAGLETQTKVQFRFAVGFQFGKELINIGLNASQGSMISSVLQTPAIDLNSSAAFKYSSSRAIAAIDSRIGIGFSCRTFNSFYLEAGLYDYSLEYKRVLNDKLRIGFSLGQFYTYRMIAFSPIVLSEDIDADDLDDYYEYSGGEPPYRFRSQRATDQGSNLWGRTKTTYSPMDNINARISIEWNLKSFAIRNSEKVELRRGKRNAKKQAPVREF